MSNNRKSLRRRGTQSAALQVLKEFPQLFYQLLGVAGIKNDALISAAHAMHTALRDADKSVIGKVDVESEGGGGTVVTHNEIVVEMEVKAGVTGVWMRPTDNPADSCFLCLGRGVLDAWANVSDQATASDEKPTNATAPAGLPAAASGSLRYALEMAEEALERFATWRKQCHDYDEDMGHEKRDFDEESIEQIEQHAAEILLRFRERVMTAGNDQGSVNPPTNQQRKG